MTQEEKELLSKDLCARLPYGVKADCVGERIEIKYIDPSKIYSIYISDLGRTKWESIEVIKPYLRPMSSMTEEEKHKLLKFGAVTCLENGEVVDISCVGFERHANIQDYLNACHLDYRGLIPMGLALEAPEDMYKNI